MENKKGKRSVKIFFLFLILFAFLLTPASSKESKSFKPTTNPIDLISKKDKSSEKVIYDPKGKTDPFTPFIRFYGVGKEKRRKTPLENYDVSQLKLVGIISDGKTMRAIIEDSAGKGYIVQKGALVGNKNGRIIRILKDRIIIEEKLIDESMSSLISKAPTNIVIMKLHLSKEGEGE